ncbi:MAG: hypothetical protein ACT4NY_31190 [Pseudonocardiales bacterium]
MVQGLPVFTLPDGVVDAVNVEGGMESWLADGRPLVAETSTPPTVV